MVPGPLCYYRTVVLISPELFFFVSRFLPGHSCSGSAYGPLFLRSGLFDTAAHCTTLLRDASIRRTTAIRRHGLWEAKILKLCLVDAHMNEQGHEQKIDLGLRFWIYEFSLWVIHGFWIFCLEHFRIITWWTLLVCIGYLYGHEKICWTENVTTRPDADLFWLF